MLLLSVTRVYPRPVFSLLLTSDSTAHYLDTRSACYLSKFCWNKKQIFKELVSFELCWGTENNRRSPAMIYDRSLLLPGMPSRARRCCRSLIIIIILFFLRVKRETAVAWCLFFWCSKVLLFHKRVEGEGRRRRKRGKNTFRVVRQVLYHTQVAGVRAASRPFFGSQRIMRSKRSRRWTPLHRRAQFQEHRIFHLLFFFFFLSFHVNQNVFPLLHRIIKWNLKFGAESGCKREWPYIYASVALASVFRPT